MKNMYKSRYCFAGALLAMVVLLAGCSEQYKMERLVWQADQAAKPVLINEGAVPRFELTRVIGMYDKVIKAKPGSGYAVDAKFKIAKLYAADKDFGSARKQYDDIISEFQGNREVAAQAVFLKGQAYELEDNWTEALRQFNIVLTEYDQTAQNLQVPMYIARYYMSKDNAVEAVKSYNAAIVYFQGIADKYPNTKVSLLCENLIVRAYLEMGSFEDALKYMQGLDSKYKLGPDTLMVMANIYREKLNDAQSAEKLYDRIVNDFPKHQMAKYIIKKRELEKDK